MHFEQPVIQTAQMFIGEAGCWLVVMAMNLWRRYVSKTSSSSSANGYEAVNTSEPAEQGGDTSSIHSRTALNGSGSTPNGYVDDEDCDDNMAPIGSGVLRGWRVAMLALPAACDIMGTTLMNAGLLLVAASIYQMTRGALVLFVGLFSVVFLHRRLFAFQWLSLVGVVLGVGVVGLAGYIWPDSKIVKSTVEAVAADDALRVVGGVLMIAGAQVFTATQFVLEEWILERSSIEPIKVVGWEGVFGFSITMLGMIVLHFAVGATDAGRYGPFDMVEGWRQMTSNRIVAVTSVLIMFSIG